METMTEGIVIVCWGCENVSFPDKQVIESSKTWKFSNYCERHKSMVISSWETHGNYNYSLFCHTVHILLHNYSNCIVDTLILSSHLGSRFVRPLKKLSQTFGITIIKFTYSDKFSLQNVTAISPEFLEWARFDFQLVNIQFSSWYYYDINRDKLDRYLLQNNILAKKSFVVQTMSNFKTDLVTRLLTKKELMCWKCDTTLKNDYCWMYWILGHYLIKDVCQYVVEGLFPCFLPDLTTTNTVYRRWIIKKISRFRK